MTSIIDIPECAICPRCGSPMKVVFLAPQAARLGLTIQAGAFVIECCDRILTIDDEDSAKKTRDILLAYHETHSVKNGAIDE